jgi:hypothetical protein
MLRKKQNESWKIVFLVIGLLTLYNASNEPTIANDNQITNGTESSSGRSSLGSGGGGGSSSGISSGSVVPASINEITLLPTYTLINGGFENGTSHWTVRHGYTLDCSVSHSGSCSIKSSGTYFDPAIDPGAGDSRAMWTPRIYGVKEGQKIYVSWWAKTTGLNPVCAPGQKKSCGGDAGIRIGVDFKNATTINGAPMRANYGEMVRFGNDWTYREFNDTIRAGESSITLWLQGKPYNYTEGVGWFDDIKLEIYNATG